MRMKDFLAMVTVYYVGEYLFLSKYTTWILHTILLTAWMFIEDSLFSWHKTCCVWRHIKIVLDHHIFCLVNQCAEKKNYNNFGTSIVRLMEKIDKINHWKKVIDSRKNFENKYPQTGFVDNFPVKAHQSLS